MKKLPGHLENPFDNFLYDVSHEVSKGLYTLGITPNMVTFLGLIVRILGLYLLYYYDQIVWFIVIEIFGYFLDCLDGYYARSYDMVTDIGDWFDHASDWIFSLSYAAIVYIKYHHIMDRSALLVAIYIVLFWLSYLMMGNRAGCTEKYAKYTKIPLSDSLSVWKNLCYPEEKTGLEKMLIDYRNCGVGNIYLAQFAFTAYLHYMANQ